MPVMRPAKMDSGEIQRLTHVMSVVRPVLRVKDWILSVRVAMWRITGIFLDNLA